MRVEPYRPDQAEAWNAFNRRALTGHLLFDRDFMDYHADRFLDASLMVFDGSDLLALLPANRTGPEVWSHQGLTFGGLIHDGLGVSRVMAALDLCADTFSRGGARALVYKAMPWIYPRAPAQDDLYWLFRRDAILVRRDISVAIDQRARGRMSSRRSRGVRKAQAAGLAFRRSHDWASYWRLLEGVLADRHDAAPTHALHEITLLAERFPEAVTLHAAELEETMLAGVVLFEWGGVAHAQYIAVGEAGREIGALDGLLEHLIQTTATRCRIFDFGISNTSQGRVLNEGLVRQKEEFGGGGVVHDVYNVSL